MASLSANSDFTIWGADRTAYGPVELPTLVSWVRSERVNADTWIFEARHRAWRKAAEVPELQVFFRPKTPAGAVAEIGASMVDNLDIKTLRRVNILRDFSDEQIIRFARFMEIEQVPASRVVVKQGECDDSMYLILEGEFRVRTNVADKETVLAKLDAGQFFGDISLFDHGPRSADVVANTPGTLLKVTSGAVRKTAAEAPDLAMPFLMAVGKTLAARIRFDNKRYCESIEIARAVA